MITRIVQFLDFPIKLTVLSTVQSGKPVKAFSNNAAARGLELQGAPLIMASAYCGVASYSIRDVLYWQHNIATQRDYAMRTCALFENITS